MALPIVSIPTIDTSSAAFIEYKIGHRQQRPYNLDTPFSHDRGWDYNSTNPGSAGAFSWRDYARGVGQSTAYNTAYKRLVDQLGESAGLGVTLVQWKQADSMIKNRASQLGAFNLALLRRSPVGVAASLGLSLRDVRAVMRTRYGVARSLSDLWLEFWFGWKPLVSDIYTACEVFDRPIPWSRLKGVGATDVPFRTVFDAGLWSTKLELLSRCKVSAGIQVRIKNPNVFLLNQFGLLNPALIAWDAVPWSFVLGWFVNVDSWLKSFTDFAGLETSAGYIAVKKEVFGRYSWNGYPSYGSTGRGYSVSRTVGLSSLPRPSLQLKELSLMPSRALTAITLLVQKLPR